MSLQCRVVPLVPYECYNLGMISSTDEDLRSITTSNGKCVQCHNVLDNIEFVLQQMMMTGTHNFPSGGGTKSYFFRPQNDPFLVPPK